ncbi:hypothetical protein [Pseudoduganella rhizocola]|uniref:hypothetical protein n=1 Tax=Pseudoduganella rhizocola TaxID=3382643 RepID=UPI0038B4D41E
MIISHKHCFIFVKTMKTAGTSIEVFLSSHCGEDDVVTPISPHVDPHRPRNHEGFYNHMPARDIRARAGGQVWEDYFTFCVERNPWDKVLSHYFMTKNSPAHNLGLGPDITLDRYLERGPMCLNHPHYLAEDGQTILVDRVLRYESLDVELGEVLPMLGIPFSGDLGVRAKSGYRTDRRHYREVLTPSQAAAIETMYRREIDLFGYRF